MRPLFLGTVVALCIATCAGQTWKGKAPKKNASPSPAPAASTKKAPTVATKKPAAPAPAKKATAAADKKAPAKKATTTKKSPAPSPAVKATPPPKATTTPKPVRMTAADKAKASDAPKVTATSSMVEEKVKKLKMAAEAAANAKMGQTKSPDKAKTPPSKAKAPPAKAKAKAKGKTAGGKDLTMADDLDLRSSPSKAKVLYLTNQCPAKLCSGSSLTEAGVKAVQGSFRAVSDVDVLTKNPQWSLAEIRAVQAGVWPMNHNLKVCYEMMCPTQSEIKLATETETDPIAVARKFSSMDLARIRKAMAKRLQEIAARDSVTGPNGKTIPRKREVKTIEWDDEVEAKKEL